jgi:hypothetical protein
MELNLHGLHWTITTSIRLHHHSCSHRSTLEVSNIYSDQWHYHVCLTHTTLHTPCLFQAQSSVTHTVSLTAEQSLSHTSSNLSEKPSTWGFTSLPAIIQKWWTNWMHHSDTRTIPPHILQLNIFHLNTLVPEYIVYLQPLYGFPYLLDHNHHLIHLSKCKEQLPHHHFHYCSAHHSIVQNDSFVKLWAPQPNRNHATYQDMLF